MCCVSNLTAQERTRKINKTYQVNGNTELEIDNQFGKVHVNTWSKNQIDIEVVVRAEFRSESRSQDFVDQVEIDISESSNQISFETDIDGNTNNRRGDSFSIDYTITMPGTNALSIENKFGDIFVDDLGGEVMIDLKHGSMKAGNLTGPSTIEVSFGSATIDLLGNSTLDFKYSKLWLQKAGNLDLEQSFSDIEIDQAGSIKLKSKYGGVELGDVKSVDGSANFSDFEIESVAEFVDLRMEHVGSFRIDEVKKGFTKIYLDAQFTSMSIYLQEGSSGEFEGKFRFGDMDVRGTEIDMNYVVKNNTSSEYKGKIGAGGQSKITVESSYGDLRLAIR